MHSYFRALRSVGVLTFALTLGSLGLTGAPQAERSSPDEASKHKGQVAGQVLSLTTKQPLRNATLRLRQPFPSSNSAPNPRDAAYTTQTDGTGKFLFQDVDPGSYWLTADRPSYVQQEYGARSPGRIGTVLKVQAGQTLKDLAIALTPQGTIAGKVTDEDGEPVDSVQITVSVVRYMDGVRRLFPAGFAATNAKGSFLIGGLTPGRYYVSAKQAGPIRLGGTAETARSAPRDTYVRTYYPNVSEPSSATAINVAADVEAGGVDIRMQKSRIYRVLGKVDFPAETTAGAGQAVTLRPKVAFDLTAATDLLMTVVRAEGSFQFDQAPPGDYILQPERIRSGGVLAGRAEVTVADKDVEGVNLTLFRAPTINGMVRFEAGTPEQTTRPSASAVARTPSTAQSGGEVLPPPPPPQLALAGSADRTRPVSAVGAAQPPPVASHQPAQTQTATVVVADAQESSEGVLAGVYIYLSSAEGVSVNAPKATSREDGTFQLTNVPLDRYHINVSELPPGTYVRSVVYNGQDVTEAAADLTAAGGTLEVALSAKAGEISGVVRDSQGKALSSVLVSAWLGARPSAETAVRPRIAATDQNGLFRFGNLAPGEYRIAAWEDIDYGLAQHGSFCALFNSSATKVEVGERARERVDIKPIPTAAIESAAVALP